MDRIEKIMQYTEKEVDALIKTSQFKFYQEYVEPLEKDHDKLLDEVEKLKKRNKKKTEKSVKTKCPPKKDYEVTKDDFLRLRKIATNLKDKLRQKEVVVDRLERENKRLQKELDIYKSKLLKGEK